jgi:hypothetical protein
LNPPIYYTLASAINGVWQIEAIPVLIVTAIASSMLGAHLSQKKLKITTRAGNKSVPGYCRFFNARNKRREWRILLVIICMSLSLLAFIIIGYLVSEFQFIWVLTPICFWLLMKEAHERSLTEAAAMGKRKQSAWPLATIFIISLFLVSLLFLDLSSFVSQPIEGAFHAPTIAP